MKGWKTSRLGDLLVDVRAGFACGEDVEDGVVQIRMNNVRTDGSLDLTKIRRVPLGTRPLERYALQVGDVVFNATNSPELVGKSAVVPGGFSEPIVFSNHFLRLRVADKSLDPRFLNRWLNMQFHRGLFSQRCRQWVNQATVDREALLTLPLLVPTLREQQRIAAILEQADALRARRRASMEKLDVLTQSAFLDLFGDPIENPRSWPTDRHLADVAEIVSGITKGRKISGESTRPVPYLAVANVQDRALNLVSIKSIEATEKEIERLRLKFGDIVLTEGGDPDKLGRGTIWRGELRECIHQNHIFRVRITVDNIDPLFLSWLISSSRGKSYFLKSAKQTTGIASINMTQLRGFPLLVPPLDLQREFARRVQAIDALKAAQRRSLAKLDALFASLQHRAFRGEL